MTIYVLALENDKYYVGKTDNVKYRIKQHFDGKGAFWTQKYKPIKIVYTASSREEDYHVIKAMHKYGIQNVRGGTFSKMQLTPSDIEHAKRMICTQYNLCYKCGKTGHYTLDCKKKHCDRCGRNNHNTEKCYAKTTVDGGYLFNEMTDDDFVLISSESDDYSSDDESSTDGEIKSPTSWYDIGVGVASFIGGFMSAMDD